jgi:hypothetical protein
MSIQKQSVVEINPNPIGNLYRNMGLLISEDQLPQQQCHLMPFVSPLPKLPGKSHERFRVIFNVKGPNILEIYI